jgi:anti-sigma B factor antagonist
VSETGPAVSVTRGPARGTAVVTPSGSFDHASAPLLRCALLEALGTSTTVVVDLRLVTFADSCLLGVIVAGHRRATAQDGRLLLVHPTERVLRLLRLTGLTGLLDVRGAAVPTLRGRPRPRAVELAGGTP